MYETTTLGDKVLVTTESNTYQVSKETWAQVEPLLNAGQDADTLLNIIASVKATDVKEYDAEKAKRAAEREAQQKALEAFESTLKDHTWSGEVKNLAKRVKDYRDEVSDLEESPMVLDLSDYQEIDHLVKEPGFYSFRMAIRGGERVPIVEISPMGDIPVVKARSTLEMALAAFRVACADEVGDMVPDSLKGNLRIANFGVDDNGNIVFDYKAKGKRGGGGGRKRKGYYEYEGERYETLTALGMVVNGTAKYPHKSGAALVEKGEAKFYPADSES